jgi:hypothetical protein
VGGGWRTEHVVQALGITMIQTIRYGKLCTKIEEEVREIQIVALGIVDCFIFRSLYLIVVGGAPIHCSM